MRWRMGAILRKRHTQYSRKGIGSLILTQGNKIARRNSPSHAGELTRHKGNLHDTKQSKQREVLTAITRTKHKNALDQSNPNDGQRRAHHPHQAQFMSQSATNINMRPTHTMQTREGPKQYPKGKHENLPDPNHRRCTDRPHQARFTNQSATDSNTTDAHHDAHPARPKGCEATKIILAVRLTQYWPKGLPNIAREGSTNTTSRITRKGLLVEKKYTDLGTEGLDIFPRKREGFQRQMVFRFCGREALDPSTTIYLLYDPPPLDLVRTQPLQVWTPQAELGRTRKRSIEAMDSNERPLIKKKAEGKRSGKFTAICLNSDTPHPNSDPDHPNRDFIRSISELTVTTTPLT